MFRTGDCLELWDEDTSTIVRLGDVVGGEEVEVGTPRRGANIGWESSGVGLGIGEQECIYVVALKPLEQRPYPAFLLRVWLETLGFTREGKEALKARRPADESVANGCVVGGSA